MAKQYKIYQVLPELYPNLVQIQKGVLYDGDGNLIPISGQGGGGEAGAQGFQGPTGADGLPGSVRNDPFNSQTVTITHSFGQYPVVQVIDFNGEVITPLSISHSSVDAYTVNFATTQSGVIITGAGIQGHTGPTGTPGPAGNQGVSGPQGFQGLVGPTGLPGTIRNDFFSASVVTITHSFGYYPVVQVLDSSNNVMFPNLLWGGPVITINHTSSDSFTVNLGVTMSGTIITGAGISGLTGPQGSTGFGSPFYYTGTGPTGPTVSVGSRWFDFETGIEYVWVDDGDSGQWVQPSGSILDGISGGLSGTAYLDTYFMSDISDEVIASVDVTGINGLTAGYLKTLTISDILDIIIFPTQLPTYTLPTVGISVASGLAAGSSYEVGVTSSVVFTISYNENDAGPADHLNFRKNSVNIGTVSSGSFTTVSITNIPNQFGFTNPNNPNIRYTANFGDFVTVSTSAVSYVGRARYQAGLAKQNNKNVTDTRTPGSTVNTPQAANAVGIDSSALSYSGLYPYFWGISASAPTVFSVTSSIQSNIGINKVVSSSNGTITIPYPSGVNYLWFATPATSTTKATWYVNALDNGSIGGPSNLFGSASTANVTSPSGLWDGISYKIYITNYAPPGNTIEMRN